MDCDEFAHALFVKLFRVWSAAGDVDIIPLRATFDVAKAYGLPDHAALACSSLFELVAHELGRPLAPESCCSRILSSDEKALLGILAAPNIDGPIRTSPQIPHGLSGAICWAAQAVRESLGISSVSLDAGASCPFGTDQQHTNTRDRIPVLDHTCH